MTIENATLKKEEFIVDLLYVKHSYELTILYDDIV